MDGFTVSPLSTKEILQKAYKLREDCGFKDKPCFPIVDFIEMSGILYDVVPQSEIEGTAALVTSGGEMIISETIYIGACNDDPFSRFTLAHEVGHYIVHPNQIGFAKTFKNGVDKPYCNSEWQADTFAAGLLVPGYLAEKMSANQIAETFKVSLECARIRKNNIYIYEKAI